MIKRFSRSFSVRQGGAVLGLLAALTLQATPLPHDPRIVTGRLTDGVNWIYLEHHNPPGKMALMLHVATGSLNETDRQRGLAHFIEHMAFNGTKHFPPGDLVPYFESIGMQFGADLNAYTSFDQTVYMLFTPDTSPEQVGKALMVLSDYAFRETLLPKQIDQERGVILEEARSGKSAFQRIRDKLWPELFAGSRLAHRLPIGSETVVSNAPRSELADYYHTWYRPDKMTVLMVGDAKPGPYIPLIRKWFQNFHPTVPARKPKGADFKLFTHPRALVVTDPEMAYCQLELFDLDPGRPPATTVQQWRTRLVESIGNWIIGRRFDELIKQGNVSFRQAGTDVSDFFHDAVLVEAYASGEAKDAKTMLAQLIHEIKRARQYGFTAHELALAREEILARAERAARTESTRDARTILNRMVANVNDGTPILSAEQQLALYRKLLPTVPLAEINHTFASRFAPGTFAYVLTMGESATEKPPTEAALLQTAEQAWQEPVKPPAQQTAPQHLLSTLPSPGKVLTESTNTALHITTARLANGVLVHHRFMDYKKDSILLSISLAGGQIEETRTNRGVTQAATLIVNQPATSTLSSSQIRDLLTGKNIHVSAAAEGDSLTLNITGSPKDLETGLQEAYALLTDGKLEKSALSHWKLNMVQNIEQREAFPGFKASEAMINLLSGGDPRIGYLYKNQVEALSGKEVQAWFDRLCRHAPIEVAVVGDLPLTQAMPLVLRYLGSLPPRPADAADLAPLRHLRRTPGPLERHVQVHTRTPQAVSLAGFFGCEGRAFSDRQALNLAANILTSRLIKTIREDQSLVYSIQAYSSPSWIYAHSGQFLAGAPCAPKNAEEVVGEVHRMFQEFAQKGATAQELANAKKQILNHLDSSLREPAYWWNILRHEALHGRNLDAEGGIRRTVKNLSADQVRTVFAKYDVPANQFQVVAVPTSPEQAKSGPAKSP